MLTALMRLIARLPLSWLHSAGAMLGWITYRVSPSYANRLRDNLYRSGTWETEEEFEKLLNTNVLETGKASAEIAAIWFRPQAEVANWVRKVNGWDLVEAAIRRNRGLIVLTPHLGCFEIIPQYFTLKLPATALYRPPRYAMLEPVMLAGRTRPAMRLAPADMTGVRVLLKTLKNKETAGILPDQVPAVGDGEWADFFGRPAYTMTLVDKLARRSDTPVLIIYAVRLTKGEGYELNVEALPPRDSDESATRHLNRALEGVIRRYPSQYIWSYNRYKVPSGAQPPNADGTPNEQRDDGEAKC